MRVEPGQRATDGRAASGWARIRLLPRPVLLLAVAFLLSALGQAVAGLIAALEPHPGASVLARLARSPVLVAALSLAAALGALLLAERPRSRSPVAYARQLRARWAEIEADFDGALRRRSGGEGENRHAPEAHPSEP
ncbi:MAG: hypothetical protein HZB56_10745 [Deltaproteobacteria bacterium]|nr:hypothetical protein [Deltaproteobacteria bacterium]